MTNDGVPEGGIVNHIGLTEAGNDMNRRPPAIKRFYPEFFSRRLIP